MFLTLPAIEFDSEEFQWLMHNDPHNHEVQIEGADFEETINTEAIERIEKYTTYYFWDAFSYDDENGEFRNLWGGKYFGDGGIHDVPVLIFRSGRRLPILETYEEFMARFDKPKSNIPKLQAKLIKKGAQK